MGLVVKRALDQAAVWHREQKRKYPGVDVPYVSHLAGVAVVLSRHAFDEEVVAAGVLHDAIEDAGVTHAQIDALFGKRVADLVWDVSEQDKSLPWDERKRRYLERFPHKCWEAQAISLADKIDNFQSILVCAQSHGDPWAMFKRGRDAQIARFSVLLEHAKKLPAHPLIDEYAAVFEELLRC